jgi:hypothetical protein
VTTEFPSSERVVSSASGLMQLLPGTNRRVNEHKQI